MHPARADQLCITNVPVVVVVVSVVEAVAS
jgi:hypothetical protein